MRGRYVTVLNIASTKSGHKVLFVVERDARIWTINVIFGRRLDTSGTFFTLPYVAVCSGRSRVWRFEKIVQPSETSFSKNKKTKTFLTLVKLGNSTVRVERLGTKSNYYTFVMSVGEVEDHETLRSINNIHSSFVRFINTTSRNVGVYWIDYHGQAVQYKVLSYGDYLDVNTFVTHPWIFVDEETRDRFRVNASEVFFPEPWRANYRGMRREELPARIERTFVRITLPMYTLRDLALRAIKKLLRFDHHAFLLEIPRSLQYELASMSPRKRGPSDL